MIPCFMSIQKVTQAQYEEKGDQAASLPSAVRRSQHRHLRLPNLKLDKRLRGPKKTNKSPMPTFHPHGQCFIRSGKATRHLQKSTVGRKLKYCDSTNCTIDTMPSGLINKSPQSCGKGHQNVKNKFK